MDIAKIILEYCKVLLSTPVIAGLLVLVFFMIFRVSIQALIGRIAKIRFPGGAELSTSQEELPAKDELPQITANSEKSPIKGLGITLKPDQMRAISERFDAERAQARLWEYRFLNYFLVQKTQKVLDWLASLKQRTTTAMFDSFWLPVIPNAQERNAIIRALEAQHLIIIQNDLIEVTGKGIEYLQWRGPLPY